MAFFKSQKRKTSNEEKDFCTLLTELIIDERKAQKDYKLLLEFFEDEKDLLLPIKSLSPTEEATVVNRRRQTVELIEGIIRDESKHEERLEELRKILCEVKER